jgi:hypothetical protein
VQGVQDSLTKVGAVNFTFRAASNVSPNAESSPWCVVWTCMQLSFKQSKSTEVNSDPNLSGTMGLAAWGWGWGCCSGAGAFQFPGSGSRKAAHGRAGAVWEEAPMTDGSGRARVAFPRHVARRDPGGVAAPRFCCRSLTKQNPSSQLHRGHPAPRFPLPRHDSMTHDANAIERFSGCCSGVEWSGANGYRTSHA